jgi:stress-induced morphogen
MSRVTNVAWVQEQLLKAFPEATIKVIDTRCDDNHLHAHVISEQFQGLTLIQRHRAVYRALEGAVGYKVHALTLLTQTPSEA